MIDITVYPTKACPHCNNLKTRLLQNNVLCHVVDVGEDANATRERIDLTGQRTCR
ncbi:MAG: glutaredoxin [Methanocalculaceae archaeon]|jgi:glutaredoxin|nr:glutaredoxin [Methanocalculaceae archaeon]